MAATMLVRLLFFTLPLLLVLLLMIEVPWMVAPMESGAESARSLCPDTQSDVCTATSANELPRGDDWKGNVTELAHHVIHSSGWKSVIIFAEMTSDADDMASLLADDSLAVTVFQWTTTATTDQSSPSSGHIDLNKALTSALSPHVLLLGSAAFVQKLLQEVLRVKESAAMTFDWLTIVPRDHKSSIATVIERFDNMAVVFQEQLSRLTLETVVRSGDVTRLSKVREWSPCVNSSLPSLTEDLVFPNKKYGLGGRTLKMVTIIWDPFIMRHQNESTTWYTGLCIDLLQMLTTKLNFTYVITEEADRNWGQRLSNGTWVGITGMLVRKEADFALSGISITPERATVTDYSRGIFFDEIVMITSYPDSTPVGWTFLSRPFHWLVFLLLGVGFMLTTVMLGLMDRWFSSARRQDMRGERKKKEEKMDIPLISMSLTEAAEVLFGTLVGRAVNYTGASTSGRVLLLAWLLLSLVAVAAYTGKLTSNSVVTKQPVPFKTLSDLVKRTDYTWSFSKGTMMESFIGNSTNKDYQKFYQKMLEFEEAEPDIRDIDVGLARLLRGNYVLLSSETYYKFFRTRYCQLTVAKERLAQDTLAAYFQKGSPYKQMFDEVIAHSMDMGILEYLTNKWFPEPSSCQTEQTRVMSVSLQQLPVAFLLAAGGLLLALGVLLLEFLLRNNTCAPQHHTKQPACLPACCM